MGHQQETDGKICERGQTMEIMVFYNTGLLQFHQLSLSQLEMLTGRKPHSRPFLNFHPVLVTTWIPPEFIKSCLGGQPNNTTSTGAMDFGAWTTCFCQGSAWKTFGETATVDQPAAEPDSYWVRFPDDSILRRTRSMIKPRSLPSHFELQAEATNRGTLKEMPTCVLVIPSVS